LQELNHRTSLTTRIIKLTDDYNIIEYNNIIPRVKYDDCSTPRRVYILVFFSSTRDDDYHQEDIIFYLKVKTMY